MTDVQHTIMPRGTVRRRSRAGATDDPVGAAVAEALLAAEPDLAALRGRLTGALSLTPAAADALIRRSVAAANAASFPPVAHLELILTEGCNLACTYCFEKDMTTARRMKPDIARAAVDLLVDYAGASPRLNVTLFGGEPLLAFDIVRLVTEYAEGRAAAAGKGVDFDMTTNGTLLDAEKADYLAAHGIRVLLSIDGLAPTHDRFRRDKKGRGSFAATLRALDLLKARQGWTGAKMTVMPETVAALCDDVVGLHALGVNQFVIGHATGIDWPAAAVRAYGEALRRVRDWYRANAGPTLRIADFDAPDDSAGYFGCQAGRHSIAVSVDGVVSPCSKMLALDTEHVLGALGDVRDGLYRLRNRAELVGCAALREACRSRGIAEAYQGGCFASNYAEHGALFTPSLQDHEFSLIKRSVCAGCGSAG